MPTILSTAVSLPPATRSLTGALVAFTLLFTLLRLSVSPKDLRNLVGAAGGDSSLLFPWLVLVPGNVGWAPWTLLTSSFVEVNLIEVRAVPTLRATERSSQAPAAPHQFLISVLTLPLAARYLERVWGAAELVKFVLAVVVVSNVIAVAVNIIEATVLGDKALFLCAASSSFLSVRQHAGPH